MIRRTACLIARQDDPYRNQAIEKQLMDTLPEDTAILYLWQNHRAITIGRAQDAWRECAVGAFLSSGGSVLRRISGGGAMYQDDGVVNFSILLPKAQLDMRRQLGLLGMAACAFGVQAGVDARGDLTANGRKFCLNAFYKSGAAAMHHGSLYVCANAEDMNRCLTPDAARATQQVGSLCSLNPGATVQDMQQALYWAFANAFGAQPTLLDERLLDGRGVERASDRFADSEWLFPAMPEGALSFEEAFPWGTVTLKLIADGGVIRGARICTDAMEVALFPLIEQALAGSPMLISAMLARIDQRLAMLRDAHLMQIAEDVKSLIRRQLRGR